VIGRTAIETYLAIFPKLEEVRMFDLDRSKSEGLAQEFRDRVKVRVVDDARQAVEGAEVIAPQTTTRNTFCKGNGSKAPTSMRRWAPMKLKKLKSWKPMFWS
jgi:ornithine cyclodeaminase/alanine dehydrogenase-like protein (mu-crystallin family)